MRLGLLEVGARGRAALLGLVHLLGARRLLEALAGLAPVVDEEVLRAAGAGPLAGRRGRRRLGRGGGVCVRGRGGRFVFAGEEAHLCSGEEYWGGGMDLGLVYRRGWHEDAACESVILWCVVV